VYIGGGKVIAIPMSATQLAIVDSSVRTVVKFGAAVAGEFKWSSGAFVGDGKIVLSPDGFARYAVIDLGAGYRTGAGLSEAALLSAWFNK
jgi:hypothetical protein